MTVPLAEQLYLSDISDEDNSSQLENTSTEEEPAASDSGRSSNVENDNGKASFPSSQSNHLFSSCSQTVVKSKFQSFFPAIMIHRSAIWWPNCFSSFQVYLMYCPVILECHCLYRQN